MKRFLIILFSIPIGLWTYGQSPDGTFSIALLGGVNIQNFNGSDFDGKKLNDDMIFGFHTGLQADFRIAPEFYFQTGLLFSTKGAKNTESDITTKYHLYYIDLPIHFVYKAVLGPGKIYLGLGPYLAYALHGKLTRDGLGMKTKDNIEFKNTIEPSDPLTNTFLKAFDAGADIFAGFELNNGLLIQLNTQLGMLRINPKDNRSANSQLSMKNTGFGLSVGYRF